MELWCTIQIVDAKLQPEVFSAGALGRGHAEAGHPVQRRAGDLGFCHPKRSLAWIIWRCRSRWPGVVPAAALGTAAVERGGTATATGGSGWRSAAAQQTGPPSQAPPAVTEAIGSGIWPSSGPTCDASTVLVACQLGGEDLAGAGIDG